MTTVKMTKMMMLNDDGSDSDEDDNGRDGRLLLVPNEASFVFLQQPSERVSISERRETEAQNNTAARSGSHT